MYSPEKLEEIKVEKMQRDGFCRLCEKHLKRNTDDRVRFYSPFNRGHHVILCLPCCEILGKVAADKIKSLLY